MAEWFEDEQFWRSTYPFLFTEARFEAAESEVDGILALAGIEEGAVLDLCCGPARHSLELARRGFAVTGVDRTPFLLAKAKERAAAAAVKIEWVQSDMRDFLRPDSFDLALSMFTSFGYFEDESEDLKVLRNVRESLRSGGTLLLDLMGKERLASIFQETKADFLPDGRVMVERREVLDDWTRMRSEWIVIEDGRATTFRLHQTIYSGRELRALLEEAGFRDVRLFGDLEGGEYGVEAKRLVAVARKG